MCKSNENLQIDKEMLRVNQRNFCIFAFLKIKWVYAR